MLTWSASAAPTDPAAEGNSATSSSAAQATADEITPTEAPAASEAPASTDATAPADAPASVDQQASDASSATAAEDAAAPAADQQVTAAGEVSIAAVRNDIVNVDGITITDLNLGDPLTQWEDIAINIPLDSQGSSVAPGDTFNIGFPSFLYLVDQAFPLKDASENVVANCQVLRSGPSVSCEFTDAVADLLSFTGQIDITAQLGAAHDASPWEITVNGETKPLPTVPDDGVIIGVPDLPPGGPDKTGWFNDGTPDPYDMYWQLRVPANSVPDGDVTLSDSLLNDSTHAGQSYVPGSFTLYTGDEWPPQGDYPPNAPGCPWTLTFDGDGQGFTAVIPDSCFDPSQNYILGYLTVASNPAAVIDGTTFGNSAVVAGVTDSAEPWFQQRASGSVNGPGFGGFSVTKQLDGSGASAIPADTKFTVLASWTAADGSPMSETLTVTAGGAAAGIDKIPTGTKVTLSEPSLPTVPGYSWGDPKFAAFNDNVSVSPDGKTAVVTIADRAVVGVTLTNTVAPAPQPKIDIEKWSTNEAGPAYDTAGNVTNDGAYAGDHDGTNVKQLEADTAEQITFTVSNNGTEDLTTIVVTDTTTDAPALENIVCAFPGGSTGTTWAGPFAVGTQFTCTATLPAMGVGEHHADTAKVTGIGVISQQPVDDSDDWSGETPKPTPDVDVEKYSGTWDGVKFNDDGTPVLDSNGQPVPQPAGDYDDATAPMQVKPGDAVPVTFTITNTGNEVLQEVVVTDATNSGPALENIVCTFPDGTSGTTWAGPFELQASFDCTAVATAMAAGEVHGDTVTVTAVGALSGTGVTDDDDWNEEVPPNPDVDIEKYSGTWDGVEFDEDDAPVLDTTGQPAVQPTEDFDTGYKAVEADSSTTVKFTITNTGNEALENVVVTDATSQGPALQNLVCTFPDGTTGTTWAGPFDLKAHFDCTATLDGMSGGMIHADTATVTGTGVTSKQPVSDEDTWGANTPPVPAVDVEKYSGSWDGVEFNADGTPVLDPATGQPKPQPTGDYDTDALEAALNTPVDVTFTITNTGNEVLKEVVVTDTTNTGPALENIVCTFPDGTTGTTWAGPFALKAHFDCTATLPGMSGGVVHGDTVTVTGIGSISGTGVTDNDDWNAEVPPTPDVDVEKYSGTWDGVEFDEDGAAVLDDGQPAVQPTEDFDTGYKEIAAGATTPVTFTITNTGNEVLKDVVVTDATTEGPALENIVCTFPDGTTGTTWAGPFELQASFDCTATLPAMTGGEMHRDKVTVDGTGVLSGTGVTDNDEWGGEVPPKPEIDIEKYNTAEGYPAGDHDTADDAKSLPAGEADPVTMTIVNTGNQTLVDVEVSDKTVEGVTLTGLSCVFPDGSTGTTWSGPFMPGVSFNCTGTIPAQDAGAHHADTATVTGKPAIRVDGEYKPQPDTPPVTDRDDYHSDTPPAPGKPEQPGNPDKPEQPGTPDKPEQPGTPGTPVVDQPGVPGKPKPGGLAATGTPADDLGLLAAAALLSGAALLLAGRRKRS